MDVGEVTFSITLTLWHCSAAMARFSVEVLYFPSLVTKRKVIHSGPVSIGTVLSGHPVLSGRF